MQREEAIALIRSSALSQYSEAIEQRLEPSVRLIVSDESEPAEACLTVSHFGGVPSLPHGASWPVWDKREFLEADVAATEKRREAYIQKSETRPERIPGARERRLQGFERKLAAMREELALGMVPLMFLGQVSLAEINSVVSIPWLPHQGVLAFFYDAHALWGFSPLHRGHCRVLYSDESLSLAPAGFPETLKARFPHRRLKAVCEWTLPSDLEQDGVDFGRLEEYTSLTEDLGYGDSNSKTPVHRFGGYPQEIQGDMRLECQLVTSGIYCGGPEGYKDPRRAELEPGAADWQLLMQFDSDEDGMGWMWGDVGRVYFWGRRQQMRTADFSDCWAILQCF